jgi:hypothetical protein
VRGSLISCDDVLTAATFSTVSPAPVDDSLTLDMAGCILVAL